jgi:hypothetical protein
MNITVIFPALNRVKSLSFPEETFPWIHHSISVIPELTLFYIGYRTCNFLLSRRIVSSGLLRRVALVRTDVSEEPGASFYRVIKIGELGTTQAATSNRRTLRRNTK